MVADGARRAAVQRPSPAFSVRAAIGVGVLYYATRLSAGDRGAVDWVVLSLASAWVLWSLARLARVLAVERGPAGGWWVLRTAGFWIIGWLNTGLIRPEDRGTWKHTLGFVVLALAALDSLALVIAERRALDAREARERQGAESDAA